ncbi:MAG: hypothetical protein JWN78_118 [Bacteroidota bacterium]|nr:hypothetical protein [Bacteroidota bacterium]
MIKQLELFKDTKPALAEYFFIIPPDTPVIRNFNFLKKKVMDIVLLPDHIRYSKAHISLFACSMRSDLDSFIIYHAEKALAGINTFIVELGHLELWDHGNISQSLVLIVENAQPIKTINNLLIDEFKFKHNSIQPHLSIARSMPIRDSLKLTPILHELNYKGEFLCNRITILKKLIDNNMPQQFKILHEVLLKN